jgi:hypothetical protein
MKGILAVAALLASSGLSATIDNRARSVDQVQKCARGRACAFSKLKWLCPPAGICPRPSQCTVGRNCPDDILNFLYPEGRPPRICEGRASCPELRKPSSFQKIQRDEKGLRPKPKGKPWKHLDPLPLISTTAARGSGNVP